MKAVKIMLIAVLVSTSVLIGSTVNMVSSADEVVEPAEVVVEEEEVAEEEVVVEESVDVAEESVETDNSPKGIIERETGLVVDHVKTIDTYKGVWGAYYCHCDGDLYCITIDEGHVDVVAQLN